MRRHRRTILAFVSFLAGAIALGALVGHGPMSVVVGFAAVVVLAAYFSSDDAEERIRRAKELGLDRAPRIDRLYGPKA